MIWEQNLHWVARGINKKIYFLEPSTFSVQNILKEGHFNGDLKWGKQIFQIKLKCIVSYHTYFNIIYYRNYKIGFDYQYYQIIIWLGRFYRIVIYSSITKVNIFLSVDYLLHAWLISKILNFPWDNEKILCLWDTWVA